MKITLQKYLSAKDECEKHLKRLKHAEGRTVDIFPLTEKSIDHLSEDQMAFIDQLIFRFIKLQDAMGHKLVNHGLTMLGEPTEQLSMIDKLHKLEALGILDNKNKWLEIRELRNQVTHEYPEDRKLQADALNLLRDSITYLNDIFQAFTSFVDSKTE